MVGTEGYDIAIHCPVILKCNEKLELKSISYSKLSRIKYFISLHNNDNLTKKRLHITIFAGSDNHKYTSQIKDKNHMQYTTL